MLLAFTTHWVQAQDVAKIGSTGYATLADAVAAADVGATIEVVAAGNYTLPNLPKNVTIKGNADGVVSFTHTTEGSVASVPNGATFKNVKFIWGNVNYHGFQHPGTINMEDCTLDGKLFSYGDMNFTNCSFTQSNADYHMWAYSGNVTYTGCTFSAKGKFIHLYNESGATKYTVTATNCTFINNASSNKAALNVKATCGSTLLAYDVIINNCSTEGSFPGASSTDALVVLNSLVQVDDRPASGVDNITVTQDGVLIYPVVVAQIGSTGYATLQAAVDAAQQMGGAQTINIVDDISEATVTIKEVANFKLTIDGQKDASSNYTVDATIVVDGLRGNGGSTTNGASVTLQNIAFVKTTSTDGIQASHYPHHLTIQDCTYSGSDNDKWFLNASVDGPLYGVTVKNVTVEHARLIYANMAEDAVFENITATNDAKVGFNVKTSGTALIKDCQVTTAKYAFRDYSDSYEGTFTLEGNTFISTSEASDEGVIVNRGGVVGTTHVNVESGTYTGHVKVLNNKEGVLAISGGYFSEEFPQEYIAADLVAQGKVCVPATDKEGFFTIGDPHYVAQIGSTGYATLQAAVDAAQQMGGAQTINIVDDISEATVTIKEVANFKLTIDGQKDASSNYTVDATIVVDGLRGNGGSTTNGASVTLQNIAFVKTTSTDGIQASHYPHHLTIQDCTYSGSDNDKWFLNASVDGPLYGVTVKNVTVEHARLIYANMAEDAVFENITATNDAKVGFNVKTSGTALIKDCQVTTAKYAFRDYSDSYEGTFTLEGNTFISTSEASDEGVIVNRGGVVGTTHVNVESGTYTGHVKVLNNKEGVLAISGGYFSEEFPQEYIAEDLVAQGQICIPATDKEGYFTVGYHYVAQIGETKYASLAKALEAVPTDGAATTIVMIDNDVVAVDATMTVAAGKNIILDLNGKTVSGSSGVTKSFYFITNNGNLEITDNSTDALGKITYQSTSVDGSYSKEFVTIYNLGGTLTLTKGTVENTSGGGLAYAINTSSNAWSNDVISTFNLNGGRVSAPSGDAALRVYQNCAAGTVQSKNYVNITGGTIDATGIFVDETLYNNNIPANYSGDNIDTKINISGGTVVGLIDLKIRHPFNTLLNITGGDFSGTKMWVRKADGYVASCGEPTAPMVTISGGKFEFAGDKTFGLASNYGATTWTGYEKAYAISGGVFELPVDEINCAEGYAPADNTDAATKDAYPYTVLELPDVAQIGDVKYKSLQAALDAAHEMTGDVKVELIDNISGYSIVHQKAGLNLTIDGADKTVAGQIIIDGNGRADENGTLETLTIQNVKFESDLTNFYTGTDAFVLVPSLKTAGTPYYTNGYNYAHNITISDCSFNSTAEKFKVVGFKSASNAGCYNLVMSNVTGDNLHSLAQLAGTTDATFDNCSATLTGSFIGANGGGGSYIVKDCTFESHPDKADGYAYREKDNSGAVATLTNNNFNAHDAIILGSAGTVNVESGIYTGAVSKTAGTIAISGGYFSEEFPQEYIAEDLVAQGQICIPATDKEGYFTVGYHYVAQIGETKYPSLAAAVAEAQANDVITMIDDDNVSLTATGSEITINKPLTITGAVDENGKPKFTIFGSTNGALNNNSFNDLFLSCSTGTVTISNLKFDGFGNEISSVMGHSPVFIGSSNQNAVIENVYITNLNCEGIHINGGTFTIKDCNIDCSKTTNSIFTKGICVVNDAQGSIENTTITGVDCDDPNDTSAAIELQGSGDIAISGCTIQTNTIGIATTPVGDLTAGTSQVTISDCTIESQNIAVYSNGDKGALTSISSGRYSGLLMAGDNDEGLSISGGLFDDMPEQAYCAEGYAPADNTDEATKDAYPYTVLELPDVAQIGDVKFKSLAAAVAAVPANGTETTITMIANEMIDVVGYAITIPANKNVVLDLNGFEVVGTASEGNTSALITNRGTLTIMDSSDTNKDGTGTGKLMSGASTTWTWDGSDDYTGSYASNLIRNEKDLIVESGYLYNMSTGSAAYGIDNYNAGNVTINGGKVDAAKASAIRMFYINGGSVSVTDGVIGHYVSDSDCTYMGIQVMGGTNANVTITGGTIAGNYALYGGNTGGDITISGGTFDGYVGFAASVPNISITDGAFTCWVGTWGNQTKFISGGIYAEEVDEEYIADGYILTDNTDEATKEDYPYTVRTGLYVAQIGTTKYESLADAIDAVGDGETITMIADVDNAAGLSVPSGKNFTVDFDGHTYTLNKPGAGSTGTETIGFQLLMNSTIVFKNGTINISEDNLTPAVAPAKNIKRIIQNYANLTLEDMTIDGTNQFGDNKTYVVSFNNGTSNIIGSTSITAGETGVSPIMDVYLNSSYTGTNVTINTTGVIGGDIETCCNVSQEKADACSLTITNADVLGTIVNNGTYDIPVSVSGGIYDEEVLEEFCAKGYVCVPTDNGRFTVMTKEDAGIFDLVDWENYPYTEEKQATQLTYTRKFAPTSSGVSRVGKYQPWIVPFDYEISAEDAENFNFYKINLIASSMQEGAVSNDQQIYINVLKVEAGYVLKANRPYILVPLNEFGNDNPYVFKTQNVTLKVPDTETSQLHTETARLAFDFYANYTITKFGNISTETDKNFCLSASGTLMWLKPSSTLNSYRWYSHVTDKYGGGDDYSNWTFVMSEDDPTGIYTFTGVDPNEIEGIYTPSGVKIDTPVKGVNIIKLTNGTTKKVYIK